QSAAQPPAPPKLLVVISVDQFSANLFDEYRPQWTGGLARLATGTVFHNGYQSHAATETCPGHSTLLTGDHPARTGIISNVPIEGGGKPVGAGRLARKAGDANAFRASPELDGDTLALAAGLVDELKLGRGAAPDLLAVSLSATDYVGHTYGTEGEEMCLQLTELDRELGDFLKLLDSRGIAYSVVLTADHGGKDVPERER